MVETIKKRTVSEIAAHKELIREKIKSLPQKKKALQDKICLLNEEMMEAIRDGRT